LLKDDKSNLLNPLPTNFVITPDDKYKYTDDASKNGEKIQTEFDKIGTNYTEKNNLVFFNYEHFTQGALNSVDTEFQKMYEANIPTSLTQSNAEYATMKSTNRTPLVLSAGNSFVDNDLDQFSGAISVLQDSILNNRYRLLKDKVKQLVNNSADDLFIDSVQTEEFIKTIKYEPGSNEDFYNLFSETFRKKIEPSTTKRMGVIENYTDLAVETKVAIQFMRSHIEEAIKNKLIKASKVV